MCYSMGHTCVCVCAAKEVLASQIRFIIHHRRFDLLGLIHIIENTHALIAARER